MLQGKKVVMVIASGNFRDEEFQEPSVLLKSKGVEVTVACSKLEASRGMLGATVKPDILLADVKADDYDAVIFVGGSGAVEYFDDETAHNLVRTVVDSARVVGAICIAPSILANAGVLKGRQATAYPSETANLKAAGARFTGKPVTRDGKIITADGPRSARAFANRIVEALAGQ